MGNNVIELFLAHLVAGGTPASTVATRRAHLLRASRCLGNLLAVSAEDLVAWCAGQSWAVETRRSYRGSLRSFYGWTVATGRMDVSPADALPRVRPAVPTPRPAPEHAYRAALAAADPRVRLMLRLAAEVGLRRAEVAAVHRGDLVEDVTGRSLRVVGKGGRLRVMPLTDQLAREIAGGAAGGWLFPGDWGPGHLSPRWVGKLVTRALPDEVTMHQLRHRFGTRVFAGTRDLLVVQDLLGHASPATTRRYVLVPADAARQAITYAIA